MDKNTYLDLVNREVENIKTVIAAKNADYTGGDDDAFSNFRLCEKIGLGNAETGVLIRMMDKIQRLRSFIAKGELKVKGESAQDAARDIIGYSLIMLGMLEEEQHKPLPPVKRPKQTKAEDESDERKVAHAEGFVYRPDMAPIIDNSPKTTNNAVYSYGSGSSLLAGSGLYSPFNGHLELGKYYLTSGNELVGPMEKSVIGGFWEFRCPTTRRDYMANGHYLASDQEHTYDISMEYAAAQSGAQ